MYRWFCHTLTHVTKITQTTIETIKAPTTRLERRGIEVGNSVRRDIPPKFGGFVLREDNSLI